MTGLDRLLAAIRNAETIGAQDDIDAQLEQHIADGIASLTGLIEYRTARARTRRIEAAKEGGR